MEKNKKRISLATYIISLMFLLVIIVILVCINIKMQLNEKNAESGRNVISLETSNTDNSVEKNSSVGTETVKEYESEEQGITKEVEEEKSKKETEEKVTAKEVEKELKVGKYTLKYGKYTFNMNDGANGNLTGTITLQPHGKFHIKSNFDESEYPEVGNGLDCDGTYKVEINVPAGYPGDYIDGISFKTNNGKTFFFYVLNNNGFSDQWHRYKYSKN
ncbi:MAG: hypothetical protein HFJ17_04890 [Clostridia bacterium]|nr:hypothetical protein [Clostridia bacterium]